MSTQIEPIVQNRSVNGVNEVVWVCKEYEKSTLNLGDLKQMCGVEPNVIRSRLKEFLGKEELRTQDMSGILDEEHRGKQLKTMIIDTAVGDSENHLIITPKAISGWLVIDLSEFRLRITLFITPKFIAYKSVENESQYHSIVSRFIKTVMYSETRNKQRSFFSKSLSKLCDFIPPKLLVPHFIDLLAELFETGPGLAREYVTTFEQKSSVRGRVDYSGYARQMFSKPHLLPQHKTELSVDSQYSRFLLHAIHKSIELVQNDDYVDTLTDFLVQFTGVSHKEMDGDYFEGVEIPSTMLDYEDSLSVASMILTERVALFDYTSDSQLDSMQLLYAPEYIFEGIVQTLFTEIVRPKEWKCVDETDKPVPWAKSVNESGLEIVDDYDQVMRAKTDHILKDSENHTVLVLESKVTKGYSKENETKRISKSHAEQLIVSMITHETLRGAITAPFPEYNDYATSNSKKLYKCQNCDAEFSKPAACQYCNSLVNVPSAELPLRSSKLFGYSFDNDDIERPQIFLLYIDTSAIIDQNSNDYVEEKKRLESIISHIHQKRKVEGIIGNPIAV